MSIRYRITPKNPRAHLFEVELTIDRPAKQQHVWLPVWIPGSYLVREFARHIVTLTATADGVPIDVDKIDKNTWQLENGEGAGVVVVTTTVYAWDLSVRAAHLDQTHAFFNGPSVFLAVKGREHEPCDLLLEPPADESCKGWRVATTMPAVDVRPTGPAGGFGKFRAADYDELCDHPVEMGTFELVEFVAGGVPHQMAITGRVRFDRERLAKDLAAICNEQIRMFHGDAKGPKGAPFARYLFLTMAVGDGYGGLEHRSSTALICKRDDLPRSSPAGGWPGTTTSTAEPTDGYRSFLGLCSHEYFHLWNVKRIKPAAFSPYDLTRENPTRLLWAFEGITSYYDDLALVRSGAISLESWLDLLGRTATKVLRSAGRKKQSLSDSSYDSWIKYYRQDENTPNSQVSYYTKGSLVALALDVTIRSVTDDARSLDDVMRLLFARYGDNANGRGKGVPEDGVERVAAEVAGIDLKPFFDEYVRGTNDVPLAGLLEPFGLRQHLRAVDSDSDPGGKAGKKDAEKRGSLGVTFSGGDDGAHLGHVHDGGAAQKAGLSAGDVVVAVDGLRATRSMLARQVGERSPGERLHLHVFRRDELHEFDVVLQAPEPEACWFTVDDAAGAEAKARRTAWLLKKS
ncbi:MAG: PDZ domain-containing protein [Deltaproteobacteria bacterium]|nr:PDZ domain-containing protein [Deltaproteobacteria bacterium]